MIICKCTVFKYVDDFFSVGKAGIKHHTLDVQKKLAEACGWSLDGREIVPMR
jgi:hypothetical protein